MQYETEEQQVEALKEWWRENANAVILGVVIGAAIIGGYQFWKYYQEKQAIAASDTFSQAMEAADSGDPAKVAALADTATDKHGDTLYASYTSLAAAKTAIEEGDLDAAAARLQWVVDNAELDDVKLIASVRLARVKTAAGDTASALTLLPGSYPEGFTGLVEEARGDAHFAAGDIDAARKAYQSAIDSGEAVADQQLLQIKLDDLAVASDS